MGESLRILAPVLDALPEYAGILSPEGVILYANRAALEAGVVHSKDLHGGPLWDTPPWERCPRARGRLQDALRAARRGEGARYEDLIRLADRPVRVRVRIVPLGTEVDGTEAFFWYASDVTASHEPRHIDQRAREILERSPDLIATLTPDGRLLSLNPSGRKLLGLTQTDAMMERTIGEFFPPWARTLFAEVAEPEARGRGSWTGRSALLDNQGHEIPTSLVLTAHRDPEGDVPYLSIAIRDATEERRAEDRLKAKAAIGQALEDAESIEAAMPEILEALNSFLGADIAEFWIPDEDEGAVRSLGRGDVGKGSHGSDPRPHLQEGGPGGPSLVDAVLDTREAILVCPAGTLGTKHHVALPPFAQSGLGFAIGTPARVVGAVIAYWADAMNALDLHVSGRNLARDMNAFLRRKEAETGLKRSQVLAEEASRAKGEFVANMSHEIRSPMTAILGYVEVLGQSLTDPDDLQVLEAIRQNGAQLLDIVSDILDLSKIEAGRLEPSREKVSPAQVAGRIRNMMGLRAAEHGLPLTVSFDSGLPDHIVSDPVRIRQILLNLVGNAIKFTPEGSVRLRVSKQRDAVVFRVDDTGIGMPPEVVRHLFAPFTQFDSSFQGTGLGLTISKRLADALGGTLHAESRLGEGSSFFLSVPLGTDTYRLLQPKELDEESERGSTAPPIFPPHRIDARVLAVDDRLDMRILLRHLLEDAGADVEVASDGRAAIASVESAAARGRAFDAIIMDVQMPVMDGLSATRVLRETGFDGPIIALTAAAQPADRDRGREAGCDAYVTKPVRGSSLIELLWKHLRDRRGNDTTRPERNEGGEDDVTGTAVLLIEDNPAVSEVMETLFTGWGCEVRSARNGAEALEQAVLSRVDVVLSDLSLPDLPGTELLPQLRRIDTCRAALCVSLSGHADSDTEARSREAGFDYHLVKPAPITMLKKVIREGRPTIP